MVFRTLASLAAVCASGVILGAQTNGMMRAERPYVKPSSAVAAVVAGFEKVQPSTPVLITVPEILAAKLAVATEAEVQGLVEAALSKASGSEIPDILRVSIDKIPDVSVVAVI